LEFNYSSKKNTNWVKSIEKFSSKKDEETELYNNELYVSTNNLASLRLNEEPYVYDARNM
jgi:hypothetical protein